METEEQKHNLPDKEKAQNNKTSANATSNSDRPGIDPDEAVQRENQGSKEKEEESGTSKGNADFENPDDDPA